MLIRDVGVAAAHISSGRQSAAASYVRTAWHGFYATVFDPFYWIALALLAVAQLLWPAEREKSRPSSAVAEDAAWFVFSTILTVTLLGACLAPLNLAYQHVAGGRTFDLTPRLGVWGVALVAFVIADVLGWYAHWLHHHVATLWYFHAIHHSQTNLNVLSDNRQHFLETIINAAIAYLPARALGLNSADALKLASLTIYWSALIHTNIRTNLGRLRYVLVSPQAHRVHHSIHPEYFNTNYGTFFIWWDMLFRTIYPHYDIYPATGIADIAFPELVRRDSGRFSPVAVATLWMKQTVRPFRLALQGNMGYAGNMTQRQNAEVFAAVPAEAVPPNASSVDLETPSRLQPFAPSAVRTMPEPVADNAPDLLVALQSVTETCARVVDRIEAHRSERHVLADAIATVARPETRQLLAAPAVVTDPKMSIIDNQAPARQPAPLSDTQRQDRGPHGHLRRTSIRGLRLRTQQVGHQLWTRTRPPGRPTGHNPRG